VSTIFTKLSDVDRQRVHSGKSYREFLRGPAMSAGLYVLPVHGLDLQKPHHQDEVYYVIRGSARFQAGAEDREVSAGSVIFIPAEVDHRFHDITEELHALVFFAPPEG
jgi:mannose-6-phosphate isomerase-like protein (cupin superfamily)